MLNESTPQAVQRCHEVLLWLVPQLDKFPRTRRFTLGDRLETGMLAVLEGLVDASYAKEKRSTLHETNCRLQVSRHLWRLAYELRVVSLGCYEHGARLMEQLGRQIGGWYRSSAKGQ